MKWQDPLEKISSSSHKKELAFFFFVIIGKPTKETWKVELIESKE